MATFFPVHLTHLDLSSNRIRLLPSQISVLPGLVKLDLSRNLLEILPDCPFASSGTLRELDLGHNYLRGPPAWLSNLTRVRSVRLNDNTMSSDAFGSVDATFGRNCRALRSVFSFALCFVLPRTKHVSLNRFLDISGCALRYFSRPHVFEARDLKELVLGRRRRRSKEERQEEEEELSPEAASLLKNSLRALPAEISRSVGLVKLVASGIGISDVPEEIGVLGNLRELDLSHNDISWLPPSLKRLAKLEVLDVEGNQLDSLPFKIEALENLREVNASCNQICWITEDIGKCCRLRTLDLYKNKLDLEGARPLQELDKLLVELDLGLNDLDLQDVEIEMAMSGYKEKQTRLRRRLSEMGRRTDLQPLLSRDAQPDVGQESEQEESEEEGEWEDPDCLAAAEDFFHQKEDKDHLSPRASPSRFFWNRLAQEEEEGEDEDEDEVWSEDERYEVRRRQRSAVPQYDFSDMSKYCYGRFDLCPSDRHAKSVRRGCDTAEDERRRRESWWRDQQALTDPRRPGRSSSRRRPDDVGVQSRQISESSPGGQFDDAE